MKTERVIIWKYPTKFTMRLLFAAVLRVMYQLKHQNVCLGHFQFTLKYFRSTLCLSAWALPTDFSAEAMASASSRFSTSVLMVVMTRWACFLSWTLRCISSGSSMSLKSLKSCLDEGKLTNNLQKKKQAAWWERTEFSCSADLGIFIADEQVFIFCWYININTDAGVLHSFSRRPGLYKTTSHSSV